MWKLHIKFLLSATIHVWLYFKFLSAIKKIDPRFLRLSLFKTRDDELNISSSFPDAFRSGSQRNFVNENFFLYIRFRTLRHKQIDIKKRYINIICDFRLSVSGEKSYHVCRFRSLLSLISYRCLSFFLFLHSFFLSSNIRELFFAKNSMYALAI